VDERTRELRIQSQDRKRDAPLVQIEVLPSKRRGRPLLIGEKWEDEVKLFVKLQRDKGSVVNTETVMATAVGVVISHDANLLVSIYQIFVAVSIRYLFMEDIPEDLIIINWDQTGLKYVPVSDWTFAEKGSK